MTEPAPRAAAFCERFGIAIPILAAPMAGACPPALDVAVANAGGMGAEQAGADAIVARGMEAGGHRGSIDPLPRSAPRSGWSRALAELKPEATVTTRAYTGRLARAAPTPYVNAWRAPNAPPPAPYPQQR